MLLNILKHMSNLEQQICTKILCLHRHVLISCCNKLLAHRTMPMLLSLGWLGELSPFRELKRSNKSLLRIGQDIPGNGCFSVSSTNSCSAAKNQVYHLHTLHTGATPTASKMELTDSFRLCVSLSQSSLFITGEVEN